VCDVAALVRPTPADLDQLARLRVVACRMGRTLRLGNVGPRLGLLLELTGLAEVFGRGPGGSDADQLALGAEPQPHRHAEQREQPLGVHEVADPADPAL